MDEQIDEGFVGWVPTAGGRLSFSVVGNSSFPSRAVTKNIANEKSRYIITFQKRKFVDSAAPFILKALAQKYFNQSGLFWFVFLASGSNCSTKSADRLSGTVYIFNEKSIWKNTISPLLKKLQNNISDNCTNFVYEKTLEEFDLFISAEYLAKFSVDLHRDGITKIRYSKSPVLEYKSKFNQLRNRINEDKSEDEAESGGRQYHLASQVYFFIKDITHTHQHHSPRADAMIDIHQASVNSAHWYSRTLRGLYKRVLQYKRDRDRTVNVSSLGLMAYIDTFISIARSRLDHDEFERIPVKNNKNLVASIKASDEAKSADHDRRKRLIDSVKTWVFGVVGVLLAVAGVVRYVQGFDVSKDGIAAPYVIDFLHAVEYPFQVVTVLIFLIFLLSMYEGTIPITKWNFVHDVIRLTQSFKKQVASIILLLIAMFFMFGAYLVLLLI